MSEASVERDAARAAANPRTAEAYVVRRLEDSEAIRRLIEVRRAYAAYALGQLEPPLFALSNWWLAEGDRGRALLLHSRGGLGSALFAMGEATPLRALLSLHPGRRGAFVTCQVEHLDVLRRFFFLSHEQPMLRMKATADTFRAPEGEARRLHGRDTRLINRLYTTEGTVGSYTTRQIEEGVYFGADDGGRLVAVAGTHAVSPAHGVAVVGNVYTHPHYRGQGLGALVTGEVTAAVLDACPLVVLSVDPANRAAVRAYRRLGYRDECHLIETSVTRKDVIGLSSLVRRVAATLRGRGAGGALVRI